MGTAFAFCRHEPIRDYPHPPEAIAPDAGPILVQLSYAIAPSDVAAFRAFAQKRYLDKYGNDWPKGALERINAIQ